MKYIIDMPDNWEPGACSMCPLKKTCIAEVTGDEGIELDCPLANAKEAVEVKAIDVLHGEVINGKPVTLYAVRKQEELK